MSLTEELDELVPGDFQDRGYVLYKKGAVRIQRGSDLQVEAQVKGTRLYLVELSMDDAGLELSCTCPFFEGGPGFCKHLWAVALAADEAGYLAKASLHGLDWDEDDFSDEWDDNSRFWKAVSSHRRPFAIPVSPEPWESLLDSVAASHGTWSHASNWPASRRILYILRPPDSRAIGRLRMDVVQQDPKRAGSWGKPKPLSINAGLISGLPDPADRQILSMILGAAGILTSRYGYYSGAGNVPGGGLTVPEAVSASIIPVICSTGRGRLRLAESEDDSLPMSLDEGPPWELYLEARTNGSGEGYRVRGLLRRLDESMDIMEPAILLADGFVVDAAGVVARLEHFGAFGLISSIRRTGPVPVPADQAGRFLGQLLKLPRLPQLDLPPELSFERVEVVPGRRLQISRREGGWSRNPHLKAELAFDYQGEIVQESDPVPGALKMNPWRLLLRDHGAEKAAAQDLSELGLKRAAGENHYLLAPSKFSAVVRSLTEAGWYVEAEGRFYRPARGSRMKLSSGVDWFDLEGTVDFGDQGVGIPELLTALRRGEDFVRLGDGSMGLVPERWLEEFGLIAGLGTVRGRALRFKRSQVGLIDALLASRPEVEFDETFINARQRLLEFEGVRPAPDPAGFAGSLRGYQREGLGWFGFLAEFGFGGCLADDMGLGKTVQVLAWLQARRSQGASTPKAGKPSLVVVPKSLVFNWIDEARRFTPDLKLLDHTGNRMAPGDHFNEFDLIVTTYGTLRRDIADLSEVKFDYCILDEAQAIKNPSTAAAKAARLLQAEYRLALSGTPIENHLGELWSLFEFLNPGMLGNLSAFQKGINNRDPDDRTRRGLARAFRPFILRRTKEQVASDLPPKTEQTQRCELSGAQRRQYDQIRDHLRRSLLARVDREGMAKSKVFVLEALLRLRQAACHPGLIDPGRAGEASAKLELLMPQLVEVAAEGHKALVFSQFTKFLEIVKGRLDREGVSYEYLDGRTRDRAARVENFQTNPECSLFLISLKAGGLGLNLTAAEYVFLLDPWWNPAVEAQAIDRAHRIGQELPVFAYRLIARNTVEEKVVQLQQSKRELADAIINADNSLIRTMSREDLELLLS